MNVPTVPRAALHVSVSQIKTFILCPRLYEFRYVLGAEREHVSSNLVLGSAVHAVLAGYYMAVLNGDELVADELVQIFVDDWDGEVATLPNLLLPDGVEADDLKDQGVALVRAFLDGVPPVDEVLGVEQPFALDIADPKTGEVLEEQLVGALDAVVIQDGQRTVLEHKTAARRWSVDQVRWDLQAGVYLAVTGADRLRFQVLVKNRTPVLQVVDTERSAAAKAEALDTVCRVLDAVRSGIFWPNRGWQCRGCEFSEACCAYRRL